MWWWWEGEGMGHCASWFRETYYGMGGLQQPPRWCWSVVCQCAKKKEKKKKVVCYY